MLAGLALTLGLLWWLKSILVPIALAILLTFLLNPPVSWLQRQGVPRLLAVTLMIAGSVGLSGGIGWTVAAQINRLVDTFPEYQQHLDAKIATLRPDGHGFFDKLQIIVARVSSQLDKNSAVTAAPDPRKGGKPSGPPATASSAPQAVTLIPDPGPLHLGAIWRASRPMLESLAMAGLTLVLVIFMLLRREDLRDRVIAVVGHGRLVLTTKVFEDAGTRISRYLVRQLMVNSGFGLVLGIGLAAIGVPYAILWGALTALLRYVPYLGTWLAAALPIALSMVLTDGWQPVLLVAGLFLTLELVVNMLIEPRVYGQGVGICETGTLVMVAFWTWLWGPIGLVLATPMTVCIVVLGNYVPALRPVSMLLADRPALTPEVRFYQRLLAQDEHEATRIAAMSDLPPADIYDQLMRPALGYLRRDVGRGLLTEVEESQALAVCERLAQDFEVPDVHRAAPSQGSPALPALLLIPARDAGATTAAKLFERVLDKWRFSVKVAPGGLLASEISQQVDSAEPFATLIAVVSEGALAQARLLCLRLRAIDADLPIIVGLWAAQGVGEGRDARNRLLAAGAEFVADNFDEARAHLESLRLLFQPRLAAA
ncbi:MAG: AI-2E family transporter [Burkholderiales bacterium]|nr:AI-2E family transporter [Burkholderiales bacterium]